MSKPLAEFTAIKKWRSKHKGPVDIIGCTKLYDKKAPRSVQKYQILVSLLLSSQTKDETTSSAMKALKKIGLTPENISECSDQVISECIRQVSFYKRKTSYLKRISLHVVREGVPETLENVLKLPGIGLKMGTLFMNSVGTVSGIGVDLHVHRIVNRLEWIKSKTPEESETKLQELFDEAVWMDINPVLVGFGQIKCKSKPLCDDCPINSTCNYFNRNRK